MKASEFRYGQYYQYEGFVFCHRNMDSDVVIFHKDEELEAVSLDDINPIPLTEEWLGLDKFGLSNKYYFAGDLILSQDEEGFYLSKEEELGFCLPYIKYVHQLQNLYHALTGEELTIKEL